MRPGYTIYIHPEAEYHPSTTLQKIINGGLIPGIAINPGTSFETVHEMLRIVRSVLVMAVNPGNAGQMFLPYVGKKIDMLLSVKDEMKFARGSERNIKLTRTEDIDLFKALLATERDEWLK